MKSKVLLLALATTAFSLSTQAQKATFGIRAGLNFQNWNGKDNHGNNLDFNVKTGFHIGVNAEVPIAPDFYVQPGLLFSTKGSKEDVSGSSDDLKYNLSYLEIPINLLYKPALGPGKLLLGFGPYFAYAVGGKAKYQGNSYSYQFSHEITLGDITATHPYWSRRADFGANFLAGYELSSKISFQFNAQLGLTKINPEITNYPGGDKGKVKNTGFGISVGYRL